MIRAIAAVETTGTMYLFRLFVCLEIMWESIETSESRKHTFWNCQEANQYKGVMMGTADSVLDVSRRKVQRMKFILTGGV